MLFLVTAEFKCIRSCINVLNLEHKSGLKYIYSNIQKYIVWVKIIDFTFMPKIIRILSKDHVPWRYLVNVLS